MFFHLLIYHTNCAHKINAESPFLRSNFSEVRGPLCAEVFVPDVNNFPGAIKREPREVLLFFLFILIQKREIEVIDTSAW